MEHLLSNVSFVEIWTLNYWVCLQGGIPVLNRKHALTWSVKPWGEILGMVRFIPNIYRFLGESTNGSPHTMCLNTYESN